MKRIAVISDTHVPSRAKSLPLSLKEMIKGVDLIVHAGDLSDESVIYELEEIAPVEAVLGNTDDSYLAWKLQRRKIITVEQCRIGILHGDGSYKSTLERVSNAFPGEDINCVIFGHSHIPFNQIIDGILYFNPGSPTDKRRQEKFSYGVIEVDGDRLLGEIRYM